MNNSKPKKWMFMGILVSLNFTGFLTLIFSSLHVTAIIDHSRQWQQSVYAQRGLPYVDNIVHVGGGLLIATLELKKTGRVVAISPKGKITILIDKLDRPDGLLVVKKYNSRGKPTGSYIYVTQEVMNGSVIGFDPLTKKQVELFKITNPEGIDRLPNGKLIVSEDIKHGNVYWIDANYKKHILIANLNRPEGLCVAVDGSIYIAETGRNRILRWHKGNLKVVVTGLQEPDQIECHVDGSVWITEDAMPGRLLRFYQKKLYLIADKLNKPQGIAFAPYGIVFVAEQGKHRIVKLRFKGN